MRYSCIFVAIKPPNWALAMKRNPFIVAGKIPAEFFCDRIEETQKLIKCIENQENVLLISPRRVGKTGLINHCFELSEMANDSVMINIDILHTTSLREFIRELGNAVFRSMASQSQKLTQRFAAIIKSLTASFSYDPVLNLPTFDIKLGDIESPQYTLTEIFQYLNESEQRVIVAIDEFQQIVYYPEQNVEALLRSHIQQSSGINFIFAGSERRIMNEMFNSKKRPFYRSATTINLAPIALNVYARWATQFFEQAGKSISPQAIAMAYDSFQGVTLYVQRIMHDAYASMGEGEHCDVPLVQNMIEKYLQENDTSLRQQLAFVSEQQKEVLYAIAAEGEATAITGAAFVKRPQLKSPSSVQHAVKKLLEADMLTQNGRCYSLSDPLLQLWFKQKL